ncbi:hypothetical protein [Microcoleus sp. B4-C1]|uniref:hypothetical protein n=1 Tax=Microcoleus sp. B4-C1 TaxID=2818660 RepID=UPI002FD33F48
MSNVSNIPGEGGLPDRFRNVGDQIQKYFDLADKNPDRAVPFFANIWETQGSLTTRALALQGLGRAAQHGHVKQALADWDVLKDIAKEVKGKGEVSSDLTRWAAAKALEDIGYSLRDLQHLEGGGFTEPLDRIRREIRDRKLAEINRIQRLNTRRETTAEYDRNLEFWLYGPVEELFAGNDHSPNYQELVKDVIRELHGRGVYLGLISPNLLVQAEALLQAGSIFKESAEIENFLYPFLEDFLHNPNQEISFRINAAEIIHTASDLNRKLKTLSKLLLEEKNPKLQEWALGKTQPLFKLSAQIEEYLYGLLEEFLHNSSHETSLRIHAAEIINTATDLNRRLKTLLQLLLENTELRNAAVRLLTPYKQELARVESDADTVLDALIFDYRLNQPEPKDLTISQMENSISSASQDHKEISAIFTIAIAVSESLARRYGRSGSVLKQFLENKQDEYVSAIESWLQVLRYQISETELEQRKVQYNQALINETIDLMSERNSYQIMYHYYIDERGNITSYNSKVKNTYVWPFPIPEKLCILDQSIVLSSTISYTYNQICQIKRDLKSINVYLLRFAIEAKKDETAQRGLLDYDSSYDLSYYDYYSSNLFDFDELPDHEKSLLVILLIVDIIMLWTIVVIFFANHQWSWFATLLIVINLGIMVKIYQRCFKKHQAAKKEHQTRKKEFEKTIENIQSILYKLNTQWQE